MRKKKSAHTNEQAEGTGDVASLSGQLARIFLLLAALTLAAALPARAAPYAAVVMDARTGETLYAKNADTRLHPASLTKMLTLYIAFDAIQRGEVSLDTMIKVSANAASKPPSRLGLKAGQRIALRHLIRAAAVKSANDAASAIGDHLSGDEARFAARMNRMAKALGMKNSTFKNANGLTASGHLSTARDMNILGRRLFYDFPQYYNIFSRRSTDAGIATVVNTNRRFLDAYPGADGIKTGYTVPAGFNLTGSAERGNVRIIATVFGGTSTAQRNAKMAELLDIGFRSAPANVAVRKPKPLADADPEGAAAPRPELLAEGQGDTRAVGKTIRLVTSVTSSPRPMARPDPQLAKAAEVAVSELQQTIDAAVAQATDTPVPAPPADAAIASVIPAPRPEALEVPPEAAPLPFEVVSEEDVPAPAGTPAPDTLPFAVVDGTEASPDAVARGDALPFEVVDALPEPEDESAPPFAAPTDLVQLVAPLARPPTAAPVPQARAAIAPEPRPQVREPEIIVRLSTSGARHWGVSLGRYPSRAVAERVLMRTGLSEGAVLGDGLRKIVQRSGGFDATFAGLTQDQADLACRRLQARAQQCFPIGP